MVRDHPTTTLPPVFLYTPPRSFPFPVFFCLRFSPQDASQDAKRRKRERAKAKVRETKTAAAVAAAIAEAAEVAAAAASLAAVASSSSSSPSVSSSKNGARSPGGAEGSSAPESPAGVGANGSSGEHRDRKQPPSARVSGSSSSSSNGSVGAALQQDSAVAVSALRNGDERSGWHAAERAAPAGDEDGFVIIAKSKPRRARESAFVHQNGGGRGWGGGRGGGVDGGGRVRAGNGGYGFEGKDRAPRDARAYEQDRKAKAAAAAAAATAAMAAAAAAGSGGGARPSSTPAVGTWAQRNSPVAQEQPEICATPAAPAPHPAPAAPVASNRWPGVTDANGGGRRSDGGEQSSGAQRPAPAAPTQPGGWAAAAAAAAASGSGSSAAAATAAVAVPAAPQAAPPPRMGAGTLGGVPIAPEEELPEVAPVPTESVGDTATGGVVNSAGEFSGGDKVFGAGEEIKGTAGGAGGSAATSSGELAPEREVAGAHPAVRLKEEEKETGVAVDGAAAAAAQEEGKEEEEEEEEEYVFQFGTVNLSDEGTAGENAGLDVPQPVGAESRDSPENLRYHDSGVGEDREGDGAAAAAARAGPPDGGEFPSASPPVVTDEAGRFAEDGANTNAGDGGGGGSDGADGSYNKEGSNRSSLSSRQPLQTEQLRDGVFFPAHPPPPPQQLQQPQDARMAPSFQHHGQGGSPMQHQHQQLPHHQQMPPPQQQQHQQQQQQQQQQQRGYSPLEGNVHGMPQHQHQLHQQHRHQPPQLPMQQPRGGGMGMGGGGHPAHNPTRGMHHRNGPSHPKGPRGGGGRGGAGSHSPNGGPLMSMGAGQYGVAGAQQQQQSASTGYWGGGMMHYQVPGQPMMGPAPGGIGVTDGQAVYYPPPPHMMVQGDGMNGHAGAAPWHVGGGGGGGHMGMGMGAGMNMAMDMNGMPAAAMPWMPDGGHHYMQQHPQQQQQVWGGSPAAPHGGGMGYTPPVQQQQQQPPRSMHAAPLPPSSGGAPQQESGHHGQVPGGHSVEQAMAPADGVPLEHEQQLIPSDAHLEGENAGLQEVAQETGEAAAVAGAALQGELHPESPPAGTLVEEASPVAGRGLDAETPVVPTDAGVEIADRDERPLDAEAAVATAEPEGVLARGVEVEKVDRVVANTQTPEDNKPRPLVETEGPAAAAMAAAAALGPATRPKKGKKDKGKKGQQQQQQQLGARQAWASSNGVAGVQPADSPAGSGGKTTKGAKGSGRPSSTGSGGSGSRAGSPTGSAKKDVPSPSAPMPRGLVNAMGQNNCFLNVVVQSLWHLEAFRVQFGGSGNSNAGDAAARGGGGGAWGKRPQVWSSGAGSGNAVASAASATDKEPSYRVEASLRALFRELSEVEGGGSGVVDDATGAGRGAGAGSNSGGAGGGGTGTTSASVEALRTALAELSVSRFGAGKMDDAAEAMETLLGCLVQGSSAAVIRQVFSMRIREALVCPKCGTSSPETPHTYEANVFYAHVSALREAREKSPACPFDVALRVSIRS